MFKQCSEQRYDYMLGILPPALMDSKGFLVGEPHDHRPCKVLGQTAPTYAAFIHQAGKFYEGDPMTVAEYRAVDVHNLPP